MTNVLGLRVLALCASLTAVSGIIPAHATIVSLLGTDFDVQYDDTKLGLYGAPTLVGSNLVFTPNAFSVQSTNGTPALATTSSTVNGIVLTAHPGFQFGSFGVSEIGDYLLKGVGGFVNVAGQLRAFDLANPAGTNTSSNLSVSPSTPLNIADFTPHDWLANAAITSETPSVMGLTDWARQAQQINLTIENLLFAFTTAPDQSTPFTVAFIEKKFADAAVTLWVAPAPVPLPASAFLLLSGLAAAGGFMARLNRHRRRDPHRPLRRTKIAIVSINYAPELTGISVYSAGMAEHFARRGDEVTIYTAFPYYPAWAKQESDKGRLFRMDTINDVIVRRSYLFVPKKPTALKRILHEFSFVVSASLNYLLGPRADCTIIVSPPLPLGVPIAALAWLKRSHSVFHVQDLQPDAAVDLGMLKPGALTRILFALEHLTYKMVNTVSTISEGMRSRIVAKGVPASKILLFRNWANDRMITRSSPRTTLRDAWGLNGKFVVLYSGNLGVKQGLGSVLDAAALLRAHKDIALVIVGDGGEKAALVQRAKSESLDNVAFKPLQPSEQLSELLATADVSIIPQKRGVKDIVLPSKLGNIMASERAIIAAAAPDSEVARIVNDARCGILVEPENGDDLAAAILDLYRAPQRTGQLAANAHQYMDQNLREATILNAFRLGILHMIANTRSIVADTAVLTEYTSQG